MGMGFAPTWLRRVSPLLHKTTLTTENSRNTGSSRDHDGNTEDTRVYSGNDL